MDTIQTLKKSVGLFWRYRATWLFGFLLALTVNNPLWLGFIRDDEQEIMANRIILSDSSIIKFPGEGVTIDFRATGAPVIKIEGLEPGWYQDLPVVVDPGDLWGFLISMGVLMLVSTLLRFMVRYTSRGALIRMVDGYESDGGMSSIRQGFRLGWGRIGRRLFLIDLSISLPVFLFFSLLFALVTAPFLLFGVESISQSPGLVIAIILFVAAGYLLFVLLVVAAWGALSILKPVMYRACGVDGLGVLAAIRLGFKLLRTRFSQVLKTWLVWLCVCLLWTFTTILVTVILLPVILVTSLAGVLVGALIAFPVAGIAHLFVGDLFAWVIGVFYGLPVLFIVAFSPVTFLSGLVEVIKSSFWTLSYREFRPLPVVSEQLAIEPEQARQEAGVAP